MKLKSLFALVLMTTISLTVLAFDEPNNPSQGEKRIGFNNPTGVHKLFEPEGVYNTGTKVLTICFPTIGFSEYTIAITSMYASLDYYITTPTVQINLSAITDDIIDISITTDDGDYYRATLDTTDPDCPSE